MLRFEPVSQYNQQNLYSIINEYGLFSKFAEEYDAVA